MQLSLINTRITMIIVAVDVQYILHSLEKR